ncbi:MAG: BamA/TamA family outer membrane protein [Bacteroidota bacterium]
MSNRQTIRLIILFIASATFTACNPYRSIKEGHVLKKYTIEIDTIQELKEPLGELVKQKPNRRILGLFYPYVWFYQKGNKGKENGFKKWLKEIGEAPAVLDSNLTDRTTRQLKLYMNKHGYFRAKVSDTTITDKRFATVIYRIRSGTPHKIGQVAYITKDTVLEKELVSIQKNSSIHTSDIFDEEVLDNERERITTFLKDKGYFTFNKNFVTYNVDTSNFKADITVNLRRLNESLILKNLAPPEYHNIFRIRNINIQSDFNPKYPADSFPAYSNVFKEITFLTYNGKSRVHPHTIHDCIFINTGDKFDQSQVSYSYQRLQNLNVFNYINFDFKEVNRDSSQNEFLLDVDLLMSQMARQDFTIEGDATNTGGNLGLAGSFGYRNKNLFGGAETFEFKIKGGVQSLPNFTDSTVQKNFFFFNTFQFGPELKLQFKKFLVPGFLKLSSDVRRMNPKTLLTAGYDLQDRPDYRRSILKLAFGYTWSKNIRKSFAFTPIDINSVYVNKSTSFQAQLDSLKDPKLQYSYDTHLITSMHFTYVYSNQRGPTSSFFYSRFNFESSGLLMNGAAKVFNFQKDANGLYRFVGIPYSQYIKPEVDMSYHQAINRNNILVYRLNTGFGIPYFNSKALPFEKSFFAGGANSMRAWVAYTLGPGGYINRQDIEQSGDLKLEANLEYRTTLLKFAGSSTIESALFTDIGNIWTLNEDPNRPDAQFKADTFLKQLGIGSGFGLRFNFSFFIMRLDLAVKMLDPGLEYTSKWVYPSQKFVIGDITPNLAIGYPF